MLEVPDLEERSHPAVTPAQMATQPEDHTCCAAQVGGNHSIREQGTGFPGRACMKARRIFANGGTGNGLRCKPLGETEPSQQQIPADTTELSGGAVV